MNTTQKYLQRISAAYDGATDYRIAQLMNTSRQRVSHWRTGANQFDVQACFHAAHLLKIDARQVIAAVELDRAKSDQDRDFWRTIAGAAASILLGGFVGLQPLPANAFSGAALDVTGYTLGRNRTRRGQ
jgi:transcriptional regulator with XRE-family HTH domain